jgi:hypothetical protein
MRVGFIFTLNGARRGFIQRSDFAIAVSGGMWMLPIVSAFILSFVGKAKE